MSNFLFIYFRIDIDECASNPCQNDGICEDGDNSYTCTCVSGYTGPNCETGKIVFSAKNLI